MKLNGKISSFIFLFLVLTNFSISKKQMVNAAAITQEESLTENVDSLRYGYNVTAGRPLCDDGLVTSAPILKPLNEGLYKYITKHENNGKTVAGNYIAYDASSIAKQSGSLLSGGVEANIKMVNLNIEASFDRNSSIKNAASERYEAYYQQINRMYYIIQDIVDLRDYLADSFINDLYSVKNEQDAQWLFNRYGTHLFTGFQYGGLLQVTNYMRTASSSVDLSQASSLSTKMNVTFASYGGGTNFSFAENYATQEEKTYGTSNYKVTMYGGEAVTAVTLDQLFTYNSSMLDGNGNYIYDRWVSSINNGKRMSIVGTPAHSKAIPLWDLIEDGGKYNSLRQYLTSAYASLCGDKYDEFMQKYPSNSRKIAETEDSESECNVVGYALTYNGQTSNYKDNNSSGNYYVAKDSVLTMNYSSSINKLRQKWKITSGSECIDIDNSDFKNGIFKVKATAPTNRKFTVGLYDVIDPNDDNSKDDVLYYTRTYTIIEGRFHGGDGTEDNPYLIADKEDFLNIINNQSYWNQNFKLVNNINFSEEEDTKFELPGIIGKKDNKFSGTFDGNNCTISGFCIKNKLVQNDSLALFAYNTGTVKNLNLCNAEIGDGYGKNVVFDNKNIIYVGSVVGNNSGTISNCKLSNIKIKLKNKPSKAFTMYGGLICGYSEANNDGVNSTIELCSIDKSSISCCVQNVEDDKKSDTTALSNSADASTFVGGLIGCAKNTIVRNNIINSILTMESESYGKNVKPVIAGIAADFNDKSSFNGCIVNDLGNLNCYCGGVVNSDLEINDKTIKPFTFLGKKSPDCNISNSFAFVPSGALQGFTNGVTALTTITYSSCRSCLDTQIWEQSPNKDYPVLIHQQFDISTALSVNVDNAKTEYYYGERFNIAGIELTGQYRNGENPFTIDSFTYDCSDFNATELGSHTIIINSIGFTTTYEVNVSKMNVVGLLVESTKEHLYVGDKPSKDDFVVKYILENGETIDPTNDNENNLSYINYPKSNIIEIECDDYVLGSNKAIVKCGDLIGEIVVEAVEKVIKSIEITEKPASFIYYEGQDFDTKGIVITATYSDNSKSELDLNNVEVIGRRLVKGLNTITFASENYKTTSLEIETQDSFTVTFIDYDGTIFAENNYAKDTCATAPIDPVRVEDNYYSYQFIGWKDKDNNYFNTETKITNDIIYYAVYEETDRLYNVKFLNWNNEVIESTDYKYNQNIIVPNNPFRESDSDYNYSFLNWGDNFNSVCKGNVVYQAVYTSTPIKDESFKIYWNVGTQTYVNSYTKNTIPQFNGDTSKASDKTYSYQFIGWDKEIVPVTEDTTYIAQYNKSYIKYLVTLVNDDGTIISKVTYHYGEELQLPKDYTKASDGKYNYTFIGWDKNIDFVTENVTLTVQYTSTLIEEPTQKGCKNSISAGIALLALLPLAGLFILKKKELNNNI